MLHRVSTKKLRFRNRVRDFIRPHFERSAFPRRSERKRRVFEGAVCCVSGFASTTNSLQNDGASGLLGDSEVIIVEGVGFLEIFF